MLVCLVSQARKNTQWQKPFIEFYLIMGVGMGNEVREGMTFYNKYIDIFWKDYIFNSFFFAGNILEKDSLLYIHVS